MILTLPLDIEYKKRYRISTLIIYSAVFLACVAVVFLAEKDHFIVFGTRQEEYIPPPPFIIYLAFIVLLGMGAILLIKLWRDLKNYHITITSQSIIVTGKSFKALGEIYWRDISSFKEMVISNINSIGNGRERRFYFFTKNQDFYWNHVQSNNQQRSLKKLSKDNGNALFFINVTNLNCDVTSLKETITQLINQNATRSTF